MELHYQKGFMGRLAKFFQTMGKGDDPYEETVFLPAFVSVVALIISEKQRLSDFAAVAIVLASSFLAGALLGTRWGSVFGLRVIMRGMSVGLLTSAGVATLTNIAADKPTMLKLAGDITSITLMMFWFGHALISPLREVALVSEQQWQLAEPRRAWIGHVVRMALRVRDLKGATISQSIIVHAVWGGVWFVGLIIAGQAVLGKAPGDWFNLLKDLF